LEISRFLEADDLALINFQNVGGFTPFMFAAQYLSLESVRFLVENGAKVDIYNKKGKGALHYATQSGRRETVQFLLQLTDSSEYKKFCLSSFPFIGEKAIGIFESLACCAMLHFQKIQTVWSYC